MGGGIFSPPISFRRRPCNTAPDFFWFCDWPFDWPCCFCVASLRWISFTKFGQRIYSFFHKYTFFGDRIFLFFGLPEFGILLSPYECILINLALNAGAFLADVFRGGIASVRQVELEAAEVLGFSLVQKVRYVIVPHISKACYPPISNLYIIFILGSAMASIFGVEELTGRAFNIDSETFRSIEIYSITAGIYVLLTFFANVLLTLVGRYVFRVKARIF